MNETLRIGIQQCCFHNCLPWNVLQHDPLPYSRSWIG